MPPPRPRPPGPRPVHRPRPGRRFYGGGYPYPYPAYYPPEVQVLEVERSEPPAKTVQAPFRIISKIFENGIGFPVVVHAFNGTSLAQAQGFYQAHMKTDAFLRGCVSGSFGRLKCREEHVAEKWDGRGWRRV